MVKLSKKELTRQYTIRLADDALILGQRLSEWCGNGPFLEEDIALTNVALDYVGRARMLYAYAAELSKSPQTEDDLAYLRDCRAYQNLLICELPNKDFAHTMARQLIMDVFYSYFLPELCQSKNHHLSAIAKKSVKENNYHLRRSTNWVLRLGDGTKESHRRMAEAFDMIWGYTPEIFILDALEEQLLDKEIAVNTASIKPLWKAKMATILEQATLTVPTHNWQVKGGRQGYHTEHLGPLLEELQHVQRSHPSLQW